MNSFTVGQSYDSLFPCASEVGAPEVYGGSELEGEFGWPVREPGPPSYTELSPGGDGNATPFLPTPAPVDVAIPRAEPHRGRACRLHGTRRVPYLRHEREETA